MNRLVVVVSMAVFVVGCGAGEDAASPVPPPSSAPSSASLSTTTTAVEGDEPASTEPDDLGRLVRVDEVESDLAARVVKVWYRSRRVTGGSTTVTGLVAIPDGPPPGGGWPVLAWAHGTTGIADDCAPSNLGPGAIPHLADHLAAGYVVAATDYEGLGGPGVHPYLVLESEGRSVLDSVRAARALDPSVGSRVAVVGHSQGGHAALAATEIAARWAPELQVVGSVAIAPVADLEVAVPAMFASSRGFALGALVAAGWPAAHPELDAADLLTPAGREVVQQAVSGACVFAVGAAIDGRPIDELRSTTPDRLDDWVARIAGNSIHPERITSPVLVVQGDADPVVPAALTQAFVDDLCDAGAPVDHLVEAGADHISILAAAMERIHTWLDDRLLSPSADPGCARR